MEIQGRIRPEGQRVASVVSAFKCWSSGNREKPKSEVMTIQEFERRAKDGTLY